MVSRWEEYICSQMFSCQSTSSLHSCPNTHSASLHLIHQLIHLGTMSVQSAFANASPHDILVVGSLVVDISCTYIQGPNTTSSDGPQQGSSNPATISQCVGGVAHNIALAAKYMGASVLLASVVGEDSAGELLLRSLAKEGLDTDGIIKLRPSKEHGEVRTGQYVGNYNHNKDFIFGMADVKLMSHPSTEDEKLWRKAIDKVQPRIIVLDTTFSHYTIKTISRIAQEKHICIVVEPTSSPRAETLPTSALFHPLKDDTRATRLDMLTPNVQELKAIINGIEKNKLVASSSHRANSDVTSLLLDTGLSENEQEIVSKALAVLLFVPVIITTLGDNGCILLLRIDAEITASNEQIRATPGFISLPGQEYSAIIRHYGPVAHLNAEDIVSVNGTGDSLVGAILVELARILEDKKHSSLDRLPSLAEIVPLNGWDSIVNQGQWAAIATLLDSSAVGPGLKNLQELKLKWGA